MSVKLTIKDIAKLSGVGKSTVSRVLNNAPNVSEFTQQKVMTIVEQYNFQPSRSARAMRGVEQQVIGIIATRLDSPSENRVIRGILNQLKENDQEHFVVESRFNPVLVSEHLQFFAQRQVEGIIVFGFSTLDPKILSPFRNKIVVMAQCYHDFSCVYYDDYQAVQLLLTRLYQQNQRYIAYIGVDIKDKTTGLIRHQAYLDFCKEQQITPHFVLGELDYTTGYELAPQILMHKVDAVVCATDSIAIGLNKYLLEHQLTHIQVSGIGNNQLLKFLFPQTLTIEFGFFRAGQAAVEQLQHLLSDPKQKIQTCIEPHFVD